MLLDVDRFKAYNDTYGHQAGDACLKTIATVVEEVMAPFTGSHVVRYGGEEIAVLVPGVMPEQAHEVARHICEAVRGAELAHARSEQGVVTASIGIAMLSRRSGRRISDLIEDADRALYRAKRSVRDQVCLGKNHSAHGQACAF